MPNNVRSNCSLGYSLLPRESVPVKGIGAAASCYLLQSNRKPCLPQPSHKLLLLHSLQVVPEHTVEVRVAGQPALSGNTAALRDVWEETSFALERLQAAEECVDQEQSGLKSRTAPVWKLPFTPTFTPADKMSKANKVGEAAVHVLTSCCGTCGLFRCLQVACSNPHSISACS